MNISIPAKTLAALIDMARSHVDDINSGVEDGTYLANENKDIGDKACAVGQAEAIYRDAMLSRRQGVVSQDQKALIVDSLGGVQAISDLLLAVWTDLDDASGVVEAGENEEFAYQDTLGTLKAARKNLEEVTDAFAKLNLITSGCDRVQIELGVTEEEQEGNFSNATLQGAGPDLAFSVQTDLDIPDEVTEQGEQAVASYLRQHLCKATVLVPTLSFEVKIGKSRSSD